MQQAITPWYRQFWPWFIISLPASAVIAGIATVIIAVNNKDGLVVDDYYKEGLAINQSIDRDIAAENLGVAALVMVDPLHRHLTLDLSSQDLATLPEQLELRLTHPTQAERDQTVTVTHRSNGHYEGSMDPPVPGRWHLQIEPPERNWRLTGRIDLAHGGQTRLTPTD